jgi:Tfp pilus assembly protein PilF
MGVRDEHINGWKSIAAYLGRDRSTVIRWTNERALPVHSLPGGKRRTIYAVRSELDAWMLDEGLRPDLSALEVEAETAPMEVPTETPTTAAAADEAGPVASMFAPVPSPELPKSPSGPRHLLQRPATLVAAGLALFLLIAVLTLVPRHSSPSKPLDPPTQADLLRSRDQIASRSAGQLGAAINTLQAIAQQHPDNADVQAALAEAFLLAREFGSLPDAFALEAARRSALTAQRLDTRSAKALRVLGVIAYWSDHDPFAAGLAFRRAIAADPSDALAHQWYANILADNGEMRAAMREFRRARQLNPGAPYLLADYAWGLWISGQDQESEAILADLASLQPMMASVHDCLSVMAFARGDLEGYARHLRQRAAARQAPEITAHSRLIDKVLSPHAGPHEIYDAMLGRALAQAEASSKSDHSWAAFVASVFSDRESLLSILRRARSRNEHWGAHGFTRRIATRWKDDREVTTALAAFRHPAIEPGN